MKAIAYILIVSLSFTGLKMSMHGMENPLPEDEISSQMDCCAHADDCEANEETNHHDTDHQCAPECDCGCCFHLTAINYHFLNLPEAVVQTYHYVHLQDNYHFDFFIPPFQPPRLG